MCVHIGAYDSTCGVWLVDRLVSCMQCMVFRCLLPLAQESSTAACFTAAQLLCPESVAFLTSK